MLLLSASQHRRWFICRTAQHFSTSTGLSARSVLARDWINESLYDPSHGYFNRPASPVGQLPDPVQFSQLSGQQAYLQHLRLWYDTLKVSWLTPAEIFQPHYGRAIATSITKKHPEKQPLNIIEVGGGSGRLAKDILDSLQQYWPSCYRHTSYTSLEISPHLASAQAEMVLRDCRHTACYKVLQQDAICSSLWDTVDQQPCVIILMELLDNLPHDKVWRHSPDSDWREIWIQAADPSQGLQRPKEVLRPVSDPLIWACLAAAQDLQQDRPSTSWLHAMMDWVLSSVSPGGDASSQSLWLPTRCLHLLQRICRARPNHLLIAADFDELPDVALPGRGAPLVASTVDGHTTDHASYLVPQGTADIFFPTDFKLLHHLHHLAHQGETQGQIMKTRAFMEQHADLNATRTQSGYNPLLEDFANTSFYLGSTGLYS
ncbi:hypothetical protein ABBQ32_003691 [Trebouxia sp. C0010 RCD-2024]